MYPDLIMLVTTRSLYHHGIVSDIYDELDIGNVIDETQCQNLVMNVRFKITRLYKWSSSV